MQNAFANALSETISKHMPLSATRRETLAWLALLIMRHGTICLWRLAAHVATMATIDWFAAGSIGSSSISNWTAP